MVNIGKWQQWKFCNNIFLQSEEHFLFNLSKFVWAKACQKLGLGWTINKTSDYIYCHCYDWRTDTNFSDIQMFSSLSLTQSILFVFLQNLIECHHVLPCSFHSFIQNSRDCGLWLWAKLSFELKIFKVWQKCSWISGIYRTIFWETLSSIQMDV